MTTNDAAAPTAAHQARPLVAVGAALAGVVLAAGAGAVLADRATPDGVAARLSSPSAPAASGTAAPTAVDASVAAAALAATGGGEIDGADRGPGGGWLLTVRLPDAVAYVLTDSGSAVRSVRVQPVATAV